METQAPSPWGTSVIGGGVQIPGTNSFSNDGEGKLRESCGAHIPTCDPPPPRSGVCNMLIKTQKVCSRWQTAPQCEGQTQTQDPPVSAVVVLMTWMCPSSRECAHDQGWRKRSYSGCAFFQGCGTYLSVCEQSSRAAAEAPPLPSKKDKTTTVHQLCRKWNGWAALPLLLMSRADWRIKLCKGPPKCWTIFAFHKCHYTPTRQRRFQLKGTYPGS